MGSKKTILIVHNYYQIPGGEDTVVANEKRMLEEHGHRVLLYTRHNDELNHMNRFRKLCMLFTAIYNPKTYRDIRKIIREEKIDIVHVHNSLHLISFAVYYASVKCGIPVIQTMHNFRFLCPKATFYRNGQICEDCLQKGLWCAVRHGCYRESHLQTLACVFNIWLHRMTGIYGKINYICLTEFNKDKLLSLNKITGRQLIKNDRVFVKPNFTFEYEKKNRKTTGNYYLFVGRLEEIKGIKIVLEAFRRMVDLEIHIVGNGKEQYENVYKNFLNIKFLGQLDRKDLNTEYSHAKALIVAAQTYEGFSINIIEAFACGLPVITGNLGNASNLVEESVTGIHYQYNSTESLIQAVNHFERLDTKEMRSNAFNRYNAQYTDSRNYWRTMEIYENVKT